MGSNSINKDLKPKKEKKARKEKSEKEGGKKRKLEAEPEVELKAKKVQKEKKEKKEKKSKKEKKDKGPKEDKKAEDSTNNQTIESDDEFVIHSNTSAQPETNTINIVEDQKQSKFMKLMGIKNNNVGKFQKFFKGTEVKEKEDEIQKNLETQFNQGVSLNQAFKKGKKVGLGFN